MYMHCCVKSKEFKINYHHAPFLPQNVSIHYLMLMFLGRVNLKKKIPHILTYKKSCPLDPDIYPVFNL
jgi:hypothetical protein